MCILEAAKLLEKVASFRQKEARLFWKVARLPTKVTRSIQKQPSSQKNKLQSASKLLTRLNFDTIGSTKNRSYLIQKIFGASNTRKIV